MCVVCASHPVALHHLCLYVWLSSVEGVRGVNCENCTLWTESSRHSLAHKTWLLTGEPHSPLGLQITVTYCVCILIPSNHQLHILPPRTHAHTQTWEYFSAMCISPLPCTVGLHRPVGSSSRWPCRGSKNAQRWLWMFTGGRGRCECAPSHVHRQHLKWPGAYSSFTISCPDCTLHNAQCAIVSRATW